MFRTFSVRKSNYVSNVEDSRENRQSALLSIERRTSAALVQIDGFLLQLFHAGNSTLSVEFVTSCERVACQCSESGGYISSGTVVPCAVSGRRREVQNTPLIVNR